MEEAAGKACLAITEKPRPQRPGGCVGIFFQLFDWNRRFARKKLFSKKLLPPARAKQASKKFGGDEKMPNAKLHLITDENSGGFPNLKKNGIRGVDSDLKHHTKAPNLVARLMGLESMPAGAQDKPKKVLVPEPCDDDGKKSSVGNHDGSGKEDLSLEKESSPKLDPRPQKLQKTGPFERQAVTRFGAEAFQIKNVLSRSRKHHHTKLASPVKSPRISSGRNTSRTCLIDVATKILEPGLQATDRAKCALTYYSGSVHYPRKDVVMTEVTGVSPEPFNPSGYNVSAAKSSMGQTSCKSCGNFLDVMVFRSYEEPCSFSSSAPNFNNVPCQGSSMIMPRPPVSSLEQERDAALKKSRDQSVAPASQAKDNFRARIETSRDGKLLSKVGQEGWLLPSQPCKPHKHEASSIAFKPTAQPQNQMSLGRDKAPPRTKLSNLPSRRVTMAANSGSGAKDFVALNRNLSGRTRQRVPAKVESSNLDTQRKSCDAQDDSLSKLRSPVRKRTLNVNGHAESMGFVRSKLGKEMGVNAQTTHQGSMKSISFCQGEANRVNRSKDGDVISFQFNSPLRNKTGRFAGTSTEIGEKRRVQNNPPMKSTSHQRKPILDENDGKKPFQEPWPLPGDALSTLLEQKLKELTYQEEDELTIGDSLPKRSTAMILQELISALTMEQPISHDFYVSSTNTPWQAKAKKEGTVRFVRDGDHLSPGSVLEASFSNNSCFSSSLDDSSGARVPPDSMDYSCDQPQPLSDGDLLDSATSFNRGRTGTEMVADFVNNTCVVLQSMNLTGLTGSKITHARDVILNAELLFGNAVRDNSDRMMDFLIGPVILDELESFIHDTWPNYIQCLGLQETKEGQLRGFLFDSMVECLDLKYGRYGSTGFRTWSRLPSCVNAGMLVLEIDKEVRKWMQLAGKIHDAIIDWDMSDRLGKWTDFDIEAFEAGEEIDSDILQNLVEEIVIDLLDCRVGSF